MPRKFRVGYNRHCWACRNPLDIHINVPWEYRNIIKYMYSFNIHKPMDFTNNISMFKVRDGKAYRYCHACYTTPLPDLRQREIGKKITRQYKSLTHKEIFGWFDDFYTYINRPDINDCEVKSVETYWPRSLVGVLVMTHS